MVVKMGSGGEDQCEGPRRGRSSWRRHLSMAPGRHCSLEPGLRARAPDQPQPSCPSAVEPSTEGVTSPAAGLGRRGGEQQRWPPPVRPRPPRPYLCPVREEDGAGEVARDAAEDEDDGDAVPAGQLLQVPQDGHLEDDRDEAVYHAGAGHTRASASPRTPARGVEGGCAGCALARALAVRVGRPVGSRGCAGRALVVRAGRPVGSGACAGWALARALAVRAGRPVGLGWAVRRLTRRGGTGTARAGRTGPGPRG